MRRVVPEALTLPGVDMRARRATPMSRATARVHPGDIEAPVPVAWQCVVLGVDTARVSGWAIAVEGRWYDSGELDTLHRGAIRHVIERVRALGAALHQPCVMALESPWGGNVKIVASLGACRERWEQAWLQLGEAYARVLRVTPNQWRGPVLGARFVSCARDKVRAHEQLMAAQVAGRAVGPDEAPAVLIAQWAAHAARVGHAIGKRATRATLRAWEGNHGQRG